MPSPSSKNRPKGGRSKRVFYSTRTMRIPEPVRQEVEELVEGFYSQLQKASELPIEGYWWQVLGVEETANRQQIRKAYTLLAKLFHTDTGSSETRKRFQAITEAYKQSKNL